MLLMFGRQGVGGRVFYGYRVIATVATWKYAPDPNGKGEGTVEVELADVNPAYAHKSRIARELTTKTGGTLRWDDAELMSDACVIVAGPPTSQTTAA